MAKPTKKQSWSNIDVFGLLNGLATWDEQYRSLMYVRKPFEDNIDLRSKIYSSHDAPPDVTKQGLINGLSVEFGLDPYNVEDKSVFTLSYSPVPSGDENIQDIFCYYKQPGETSWSNLGPQVWPDGYSDAKKDSVGFICWQNNRYTNISGYKNYRYSNLVEVFRSDLVDETQLKFVYYVYVSDNENNRQLVSYTDMNNQTDSNDVRYTYRKAVTSPSLSGQTVAYVLNDIPENIKYKYYYDEDTGIAKSFLYDLKEYIDKRFKHTWDTIIDRSCIWDVHTNYGSGHIPHFYDAIAPKNNQRCSLSYSGYTGGIEDMSYALYPEKIVESGAAQNWYLKIYPGRFYIDGIPFYYFENPQKDYVTFVSGIANIPSGLERGMYTIAALSGYYSDYCTRAQDEYLSGVYEDYNYQTGPDGDSMWCDIYRKRPYLTSQMGHEITLGMGEYSIDWESGVIHSELPGGYENAVILWDNVLVPSGTLLRYDVNPLNEANLAFEKFFIYLSLDPNRR